MRNWRAFTLAFKPIVILLYFHAPAFSQTEGKFPPIFNEFTVSTNLSLFPKTSSDEGRVGFGVGMYHVWFEPKRVNLVAGVSYNMYSKYSELGSPFGNQSMTKLSNMKSQLHLFSFSVASRFNLDRSKNFFVDLGIFTDYHSHMVSRGFEEKTHYRKYINDRVDPFFSVGGTCGIGYKIPLKKNGLIVRSYYHHSIWNKGVINLSFGYRIIK